MKKVDDVMLLSNDELKNEMDKLEATYKVKQEKLRIVIEEIERLNLEMRDLSKSYVSIRKIYDKRTGNKN